VIVKSFGALQSFTTKSPAAGGVALVTSSRSVFDSMSLATYAAIWRTQPNVRTVVDFLARNVAQIPLQGFRRLSDLDRERLADHAVLQWLDRPNPGTTRYRLFESLMQDMGIYFNAYWLKVRREDDSIGLVRLPPEEMTVQGWLVPSGFTWTLPDGRSLALARESVVYFNGYDPCNPLMGLSPLETLRGLLLEDAAQTSYRQNYWKNASRIDGVITRPIAAGKWKDNDKQTFREQLEARHTGNNAVSTLILDEGMTFAARAFSPRESEFVAARKLTDEEVARAYHVPLPMVGILDHATFSNIKEQHKQLYQDCLGPWLQMISEELERQLLPEARDTDRVYLEFNIAEKMKGSFEEQAASLYTLIGRPIMTANEGRARLNLPRITDDASADALALPLNTASGAAAPPLPDRVTTALLEAPSVQARVEALEKIIDGELALETEAA
jgi:HK97 family phage portal protein